MTAALAVFGLLWGLSLPEILGIAGSAGSGIGAVVSAWFAVQQAKKDTRLQAEAECAERMERLFRMEHGDQ
jgi:hypothetical protein